MAEEQKYNPKVDISEVKNVYSKSKISINELIKKYLIDAIVIVTSAVYILRAFTTITQTGQTVWDILSNGALYFIFAMTIKQLLSNKGLLMGMAEPKFIATQEVYSKQMQVVEKYMDELDEYCDFINKKNLDTEIKNILHSYALTIDAYYSWLDGQKFNEQRTLDLNVAHSQIKKLKIVKITHKDLVSERGKKGDYGLGDTLIDYQKGFTIKTGLSAILCSIIFGVWGFKLIENFSRADLIYYTFQVATALMFGVLALFNAYSFIINQYRQRFISKYNHLIEFEVFHKKKIEQIVTTKVEDGEKICLQTLKNNG